MVVFIYLFIYLLSIQIVILVLVLNGLGAEALESLDGDEGDKSVHPALGVLILAGPAGKVDADAVGDAADTLGPDVLVDRDIKTDVVGAHGLSGEILDDTDGLGSPLLEGTIKKNEKDVKGRD